MRFMYTATENILLLSHFHFADGKLLMLWMNHIIEYIDLKWPSH